MEDSLKQAVELIHKSPTRIVLHVSGGASHVSAWLLSVPGASNTVLEVRIPYDRTAILETIGSELRNSITSFSSTASARALAQSAYRRAVSLSQPGVRVCGIAAACALLSSTPKKGDHRAFVVAHSSERVVEYTLRMEKGRRKRYDEEELTSRFVLQALLDDCEGSPGLMRPDSTVMTDGVSGALSISRHSTMALVRHLLVSGDQLHGPVVYEHSDCVEAVVRGEIKYAELTRGVWSREATHATMIFPGAFNPLHYGHRELLAVAQSMYPNDTAAFELSVTNVDKPTLEASVVRSRIQQFHDDDIILISRAMLFKEKGQLFPNSRFVVGMDTATRIVSGKYYGGETELIKALVELKSRGCSFLVAGRLEQRKDGVKSDVFQTLEDLKPPAGFDDMFEVIPSSKFRADVSSSEIRRRKER
ncbi:hypothetical protein BWQ96_10313 [Gracilariopsis chorda]|uniref:Cytidyltransferase-like domain-containing protein n=1 Tax=Gracilariopsis chorda TaxID=448386 RepID=A0A2V3ID15_9FLOR|nr:hypothetical protein BWQ96_10313 [Gracilariopsis chorda]|eukprot:PXF39985.1 hypothetical protein BWQ96_10313 [Gracilariopsis chorda]